MALIDQLAAREILDSRGSPTLAVSVVLGDGSTGWAAVPSGASTGSRQAVELCDGGWRRDGGKGVLRAIAHVEGPLAAAVRGREATDQRGLDAALLAADGTSNNHEESRVGESLVERMGSRSAEQESKRSVGYTCRAVHA